MKITNCNMELRYINLAGIGFETNSDYSPQKRIVYDLTLSADTPGGRIKTRVKIAFIRMGEPDNDGNYLCGAVYRHLSDEQVSALKEIAECFNSKRLAKRCTFTASISEIAPD